MKVKLTYFKNTGKFYSNGEYNTKLDSLFDIWDEVEYMDEHPDIIDKWTDGPILVNVPGHKYEHPRLIYCK
jgi:hypothetical protein